MIRHASPNARLFASSVRAAWLQGEAPLIRSITLNTRCLVRTRSPVAERCTSARQFCVTTFPRTSPSDDTIYAISTAAGKAAIAVVRISGPLCREVCYFYHANDNSNV
jgi:hypothetical protein